MGNRTVPVAPVAISQCRALSFYRHSHFLDERIEAQTHQVSNAFWLIYGAAGI